DLIGQIGESATPLRPAGTMILNDERIDVVTEGNYIDVHKRVKVVFVEGMRVVVREIKEDTIKEE
ncbi:MAG TPA: NfeD family protein, partial [Pseudogracilibacillus sp.]|nr:NfeD family protein [Pseudogracilibacillus sp.]